MTARPILTAEQMRAAELGSGVPLAELMQRAGVALGKLVWRIASGRPVTVLVGPGNNGGDGYVAARWLREQGATVRVIALSPAATDLARNAARDWQGATEGPESSPTQGAILVDCLFGTGLSRTLSADPIDLLTCHVVAAASVISADLPSGVGCDNAADLGCPIVADITLAFAALKPAHLLFPAASRCGRVEIADIGIAATSDVMTAAMPLLASPDWQSHKYRRGLVAVLAGSMAGAAELAARGALRSGTGYVRLIGSSAPPTPPHAIVRQSWRDGAALADPRIDAIVIGCGLGQGDTARTRFDAALATGKPMVIDGDALALLSDQPLTGAAILTPHAGEFARLSSDGGASKIDATRALAKRLDAVVVHKGPDSVIAAPDGRVAVQSPGNPWLSSAGTGDVLAGMCGAMLARGLEPFVAAQAAVISHQNMAQRAGAGLCADDLIEGIGRQ
jgi:ADP-dependent NAD(P)H-hydrate dehydratase / NAD(P)H-hydrate epimerase